MINTKTLTERIKLLVERATAAHKKMNEIDRQIDLTQWLKDDNEMAAELTAIDKEAGPGLCVGRCLSFGVADGSANYIVTKIRKNDVVVEWVPLCDGYFSDAVGLSRDKTQYVVNRHTAEGHCRMGDVMNKMTPMALMTPVTA
jgi:hypothetical protein